MADYAVYVRRVEDLLCRRLVATLRMGGIYWRLALYYSPEPISTEKYMSLMSEDEAPLTRSEEEVLIGMYHVYTSQYKFVLTAQFD